MPTAAETPPIPPAFPSPDAQPSPPSGLGIKVLGKVVLYSGKSMINHQGVGACPCAKMKVRKRQIVVVEVVLYSGKSMGNGSKNKPKGGGIGDDF